ncbi:glycoside hydrolase superfamily [Mycena maculata]|uniref:beta-glucosidase n=1 Tax=Mycena maculata TaxID=230809 RepID=A0AAD7NVC5_9AGAR|nr:glycoside hydrolase superfamily [Mycena maculata]
MSTLTRTLSFTGNQGTLQKTTTHLNLDSANTTSTSTVMTGPPDPNTPASGIVKFTIYSGSRSVDVDSRKLTSSGTKSFSSAEYRKVAPQDPLHADGRVPAWHRLLQAEHVPAVNRDRPLLRQGPRVRRGARNWIRGTKHACFVLVLDLDEEPRWGRVQEAWREDFVLTSHMGVAYVSGLSKNARGRTRTRLCLWSSTLLPTSHDGDGRSFKVVIDLDAMMVYHVLDEVSAVVSAVLYDALADWGYDEFIVADDNGIDVIPPYPQLRRQSEHGYDPAVVQHQYYDFTLDIFLNLVANGTIPKATLKAAARRILSTKYDLGLFDDPYIPDSVGVNANTTAHLFIEGKLAADSPLTLADHQEHRAALIRRTNETRPPPAAIAFTFAKGATHAIRVDVEVRECELAQCADRVALKLGGHGESHLVLCSRVKRISRRPPTSSAVDAKWNGDAESADHATFNLSANQTVLADPMFALGKPVVIVLQGGRPSMTTTVRLSPY